MSDVERADPGLARRIVDAPRRAGRTQEEAAAAIGVSQATYSRIESADRILRADELILLADLLRVRVAALTGVAALRERACFAARSESPELGALRERLEEYLELDAYLSDHGITA